MPAIQYKLDGHLVFVRQATGREAVEVWSQKGTPVRVLWKGFIADNNIASLGSGGYGKMLAVSVTSESGVMCGWRQVMPDEYVLCYRVPTDLCESGCAVYALVDRHNWPIVMGHRMKPEIKKSEGFR